MDEITLGELGRRLELVHSDLSDLRAKMIDKDDLASFEKQRELELMAVRLEVENVRKDSERRLDALESWNIWAIRIAGGAFITALVALVLKFAALL